MSALDTKRHIRKIGGYDNLESFPGTAFTVEKRSYFQFVLSAPDTMNWEVAISPITTYYINIYNLDYERVASLAGWTTSTRFPITLMAGNYILEIEVSEETSFTIDPGRRFFSKYISLHPIAQDGESGIANIHKVRRTFKCNQPMRIDIVEGELPPGLKIAPYDLFIYGVIGEMDCVDDKDIPSFDWFYINRDNNVQSQGRIFRFKVRLSLVGDPNVYDEKWLCIRVSNNWTWDTELFNDEMERAMKLIQTGSDTVSLMLDNSTFAFGDTISTQDLTRVECIPCNDISNFEAETIIDVSEFNFRFPFQVRDWYIANQHGVGRLISVLDNNRLFQEAFFSIHPESVAFEFKMENENLIIRKFNTRFRSLKDTDQILLSTVNIMNTKRHWETDTTDGEYARVEVFLW